MLTKTRTGRITTILFWGWVFLGFFILYTRIAPITVFNMDDWRYISYRRSSPLPTPGNNPIRVLPEILMPLTAQISMLVIYPFFHDAPGSVELGMAIVISLFATIYVYSFFRMMRRKTTLSPNYCYVLSLLFILLHFLVFRTGYEGNDFLLNGYYDATTFFFYLVPALLNASLVMYCISTGGFREAFRENRRYLFIISLYFAVFSNLHQKIILAAYVFVDMVFQFADSKKVKRITIHACFLLAWLCSLGFEMTGGRASSVGIRTVADFWPSLLSCGKTLLKRIRSVNSTFIFLFVLAVALTLAAWLLSGKGRDKFSFEMGKERLFPVKLLLMFGLTIIYLVLLCSVSIGTYIKRGDVLLSALFFIFVFICFSFVWLFQSKTKLKTIFPLIFLICAFYIPTSGLTLKSSINNNISHLTAKAITQDIVTRIIQADQNNENELVIKIPIFKKSDNWPLSQNGGTISEFLCKYHVISKRIGVQFEPDNNENVKYGLQEY